LRGIKMKKFLTYLLCFLVLMVPMTTLTSCDLLRGSDAVVTTADNVKPGAEAAKIPTEQIPGKVKEAFKDKPVVIAHAGDVIDPTKTVAIADPTSQGSLGTVFDLALQVGKTFIPGLAAWEGVLTILSQRKRDHYSDAVKSIIPTTGSMDIGAAISSLGKGLGVAHSDADTKAVWDETKVAVEPTKDTTIIVG
jgi:hypothetical protein